MSQQTAGDTSGDSSGGGLTRKSSQSNAFFSPMGRPRQFGIGGQESPGPVATPGKLSRQRFGSGRFSSVSVRRTSFSMIGKNASVGGGFKSPHGSLHGSQPNLQDLDTNEDTSPAGIPHGSRSPGDNPQDAASPMSGSPVFLSPTKRRGKSSPQGTSPSNKAMKAFCKGGGTPVSKVSSHDTLSEQAPTPAFSRSPFTRMDSGRASSKRHGVQANQLSFSLAHTFAGGGKKKASVAVTPSAVEEAGLQDFAMGNDEGAGTGRDSTGNRLMASTPKTMSVGPRQAVDSISGGMMDDIMAARSAITKAAMGGARPTPSAMHGLGHSPAMGHSQTNAGKFLSPAFRSSRDQLVPSSSRSVSPQMRGASPDGSSRQPRGGLGFPSPVGAGNGGSARASPSAGGTSHLDAMPSPMSVSHAGVESGSARGSTGRHRGFSPFPVTPLSNRRLGGESGRRLGGESGRRGWSPKRVQSGHLWQGHGSNTDLTKGMMGQMSTRSMSSIKSNWMLADDELRSLCKMVADSSGLNVEWTNFAAAMLPPEAIKEEKIKEVFSWFDIERDGRISAFSIERLMGGKKPKNKDGTSRGLNKGGQSSRFRGQSPASGAAGTLDDSIISYYHIYIEPHDPDRLEYIDYDRFKKLMLATGDEAPSPTDSSKSKTSSSMASSGGTGTHRDRVPGDGRRGSLDRSASKGRRSHYDTIKEDEVHQPKRRSDHHADAPLPAVPASREASPTDALEPEKKLHRRGSGAARHRPSMTADQLHPFFNADPKMKEELAKLAAEVDGDDDIDTKTFLANVPESPGPSSHTVSQKSMQSQMSSHLSSEDDRSEGEEELRKRNSGKKLSADIVLRQALDNADDALNLDVPRDRGRDEVRSDTGSSSRDLLSERQQPKKNSNRDHHFLDPSKSNDELFKEVSNHSSPESQRSGPRLSGPGAKARPPKV